MNKRGQGFINAKFKTKELYSFYKEKNNSKISQTTFNKILGEINESIFKEIIENNFEFTLPLSLGKFRIRKTKIKLKLRKDGTLDTSRLIPDWNKTLKLWEEDPECKAKKQIVYLTNNHSNGYKYNFHWNKTINKKHRVRNIGIMCFRATKSTRQLLRDTILNPFINVNYFE